MPQLESTIAGVKSSGWLIHNDLPSLEQLIYTDMIPLLVHNPISLIAILVGGSRSLICCNYDNSCACCLRWPLKVAYKVSLYSRSVVHVFHFEPRRFSSRTIMSELDLTRGRHMMEKISDNPNEGLASLDGKNTVVVTGSASIKEGITTTCDLADSSLDDESQNASTKYGTLAAKVWAKRSPLIQAFVVCVFTA